MRKHGSLLYISVNKLRTIETTVDTWENSIPSLYSFEGNDESSAKPFVSEVDKYKVRYLKGYTYKIYITFVEKHVQVRKRVNT